MSIGWYGALLECLSWWNLNICFMFSGYLGVSQIATQVVIMQIKNFTTMIPTGVAFAASGLVGNCIGMNQVYRAKQYAKVSILYSIFVTVSLLSAFTVYADEISKIFTNEPSVVQSTKNCLWSLFLYILASTVKGVQNGIVRSLGLQKRNSCMTLVFAYGLGIPLAALFCFQFQMGLSGMWFGIAIANFLLVVAINHVIQSTNWESIAQRQQQQADRKTLVKSLL